MIQKIGRSWSHQNYRVSGMYVVEKDLLLQRGEPTGHPNTAGCGIVTKTLLDEDA
jgi:hypothetical protein